MKGLGFFVGGLLLDAMGFKPARWLMAGLIGVVLVGCLSLPRELGKAKASKSMRELFAKSAGVNLLAAARIVMFDARDVWFVVGLPVFLYANGWRFAEVGPSSPPGPSATVLCRPSRRRSCSAVTMASAERFLPPGFGRRCSSPFPSCSPNSAQPNSRS